MRMIDPRVELASGTYDHRKMVSGKEIGIEPIARQFGIPANKLRNYRANYISRNKNHEKNRTLPIMRQANSVHLPDARLQTNEELSS